MAGTIALLAALAMGLGTSTPQDDWIALFDGKTLDGWTPKIKGYPLGENFAQTFRAENGVLLVSYDGYGGKFEGRFGHLFYKSPFSRYLLQLEYRFTGEQLPDAPGWAFRNSGVMIHGQAPETMGRDQDFPVSIEVQLLGGNGKDERPTANVCTPGTVFEKDGKLVTAHCTNSSSKTYHGDQWVSLEIEVRGAEKIVHRVNGETVFAYEKPQLDEGDALAKTLMRGGDKVLTGGSISLQAESHPVEFRRIRLRRLP
jgi:hypothetical protein